jgi:hypothetical protein
MNTTDEPRTRGKNVNDPELKALAAVTEALEGLDNGAQQRVVNYIRQRYAPLFGVNGGRPEDAG